MSSTSRFTPEQDALILSDRKPREVAEILDMTSDEVSRRRYRLRQKMGEEIVPHRAYTQAEKEVIMQDRPIADIARELGLTSRQVYSARARIRHKEADGVLVLGTIEERIANVKPLFLTPKKGDK